jgi:hypothetical protein
MCRSKDDPRGYRRCEDHTHPEYKEHKKDYDHKRYIEKKQQNEITVNNFFKPEQIRRFHSQPSKRSWAKSLTKEERKAVEEYSAFSSNETNRYLYHDKFKQAIDEGNPDAYPATLPKSEIPAYRSKMLKRIELLDSAFNKIDNQQTRILYRGESFNIPFGQEKEEYIKNNYAIGKVFERTSYMSTSSNPAIPTNFGGEAVMFEIVSHNSAELAHLTRYKENEFLIPRNSKFRVVAVHNNVEYQKTRQHPDVMNKTMLPVDETKTYTVIQIIQEN